jgi:hypothetical protein
MLWTPSVEAAILVFVFCCLSSLLTTVSLLCPRVW